MVLCNFIVESLHLMVEGEQELFLVRKGTFFFFEAVRSVDCDLKILWNNTNSCIARCKFSLRDSDSLCNCTFHVQAKKWQWKSQEVVSAERHIESRPRCVLSSQKLWWWNHSPVLAVSAFQWFPPVRGNLSQHRCKADTLLLPLSV